MSVLTVGRLSATVHTADSRPVDRMLRRLAERRLDEAMAAVTLPPGDWCLRRVDAVLRWDADHHESDVERAWAQTLVASLYALLEGSSTSDTLRIPGTSEDIVHYRTEVDALADVIASLAGRDHAREWAWRQLGLRVTGDPPTGADPLGAVLAAAERRPHAVSAALTVALSRVGAAALHRLFGSAGWPRIAAVVTAAHGCSAAETADLLTTGHPVLEAGAEPGADIGRERVRAMLRGAELAVALGRAGLRADAATARAWAVLDLTAADPAGLRAPRAAERVTLLAHALAGSPPAAGLAVDRAAAPRLAGVRPGGPEGARTTEDTTPLHQARPAEPGMASAGAAADAAQGSCGGGPDDISVGRGAVTEWAGLLFLLATAADAGLPDRLHQDPALVDRSVRWTLHRLALELAPYAAEDDPAVLALAGQPPTADPPAGPGPNPAEQAALTATAGHWRAATARRLDPDAPDAENVIAGIIARRGEVVADPGWLEVVLDIADIDFNIRRAGLDLDPGWVPWLGVVVRFRYVGDPS